jgi:hypothetical protein
MYDCHITAWQNDLKTHLLVAPLTPAHTSILILLIMHSLNHITMHLFHNKHTDYTQKENHSLEIDLMPQMYIHNYTQCRILSKAPALNDLHKHTADALLQKIVQFRPRYS